MGKFSHLFLDIGEVLLTNGWDTDSRKRAAAKFKLEWKEFEERHQEMAGKFEVGKITIDEYLKKAVFTKKRSFTADEFKHFMFGESKPYPQMLELTHRMKKEHGFKVFAISNESREINAYRIQKFKLDSLMDGFISSCYVHFRKPEPEIFLVALDITQAKPEKSIYIENTPLYVEVAQVMGFRSILHKDYTSTCEKLASLGLQVGESKRPAA